MKARISPYPNGPYLVRGEFEVTDPEGRVIETRRATIALCRCGASQTKPFCDGTHKAIGFKAAGTPAERTPR
jgi:CDGSH-type Zn-finger protein